MHSVPVISAIRLYLWIDEGHGRCRRPDDLKVDNSLVDNCLPQRDQPANSPNIRRIAYMGSMQGVSLDYRRLTRKEGYKTRSASALLPNTPRNALRITDLWSPLGRTYPTNLSTSTPQVLLVSHSPLKILDKSLHDQLRAYC